MARRLLKYAQQVADETTEGTAMGQLGRIAQNRRDFTTAEQWHGKSLAINEHEKNKDAGAAENETPLPNAIPLTCSSNDV